MVPVVATCANADAGKSDQQRCDDGTRAFTHMCFFSSYEQRQTVPLERGARKADERRTLFSKGKCVPLVR